MNNQISFNRNTCVSNAQAYDRSKTVTFRQRLALVLGAKQHQRKPKDWTIQAEVLQGYMVEFSAL